VAQFGSAPDRGSGGRRFESGRPDVMYLVQVRPGQEVLTTIREDAKARSVTDAAIVSLIGAVDMVSISNMIPSAAGTENVMRKYTQPMELSGSGEIVDGQPHLHVVVSMNRANMADDMVVGGHLWLAEVVHHFVHAYVWPFA
jgi:uncharacterized protein